MLVCILCGNQDGPWSFEEGIGFVCEDCIENGSLAAVKQDKEDDQR